MRDSLATFQQMPAELFQFDATGRETPGGPGPSRRRAGVFINGASFIPSARALPPIFKARMFAPMEA